MINYSVVHPKVFLATSTKTENYCLAYWVLQENEDYETFLKYIISEMLEVTSHCFYCATWISGPRLTFSIHYSMTLDVSLLDITNLKEAHLSLTLIPVGLWRGIGSLGGSF